MDCSVVTDSDSDDCMIVEDEVTAEMHGSGSGKNADNVVVIDDHGDTQIAIDDTIEYVSEWDVDRIVACYFLAVPLIVCRLLVHVRKTVQDSVLHEEHLQ